MPTEPSKYAINPFAYVTEGSFALMSELLASMRPKVADALGTHPEFELPLDVLDEAIANWEAGETLVANAEANGPACTFAFQDKLNSLVRKPNADTNSPIEIWDTTIRGQVAYQGPTYMLLLPQGRETLTAGTFDARLDAGRDFGIRLAAQSTHAVLVTLGGTVTTFYDAARALRVLQGTAKTSINSTRVAQEVLRLAAASAMLNVVGAGLMVFRDNPSMVDTLFDVNLLRGGALVVPDAVSDTLWTPEERKLSTSAMPDHGTRLAAWREGPGGMPEQLAIGVPGALEVIIPATITFDVGDLYQLWLLVLNSKGPSGPGPVQTWTAT